MKWADIFDEQNKLERKKELITMRNLLDGIIRMGRYAATYEEFIINLSKLLDKIDNMIAKP